jgi:hypothetical protein
MKLFDPSIPARDPVYIALRDYSHLADARKHVEKLWQDFKPYADPHFVNEIAVKFQAKYWEMYLGCLALRMSLLLVPTKGKGPDLRIWLPTGSNLFIEAKAPGSGIGQNSVAEPKLINVSDSSAIFEDVPVEQVILRITSGVEEKFKAHRKYLQDKTLQPDDPYVVAVNPGCMTFARGNYDPPLIIQALFAVGNLMVLFDREDPARDETRYSIRHQIIKYNDKPIRTNYFLDSEYSSLSAVIFSDAYALSLPKPDGREFKLVHNPYARNPISRGLFKVGSEYWAEGTRIRSTNWNEIHDSATLSQS